MPLTPAEQETAAAEIRILEIFVSSKTPANRLVERLIASPIMYIDATLHMKVINALWDNVGRVPGAVTRLLSRVFETHVRYCRLWSANEATLT